MAVIRMHRFLSSTSFSADSIKPLMTKSTSIKGILQLPSVVQGTGITPTSPPNTTLVILVGWAMAKQKHVGKYSQVYNDYGLPTLSVTPNILHTWDIFSHDKYTRNLMQVIDSSFKGSILLHLFSGAGFLILPHLTQNLSQYKNINLKGIVFDCAPSLFGQASGMAAASMALKQGGMNILTYYLSTGAGTMIDKIKGTKIRQRAAEALLRPSLDGVPQLYMYSNTDIVMPMKIVEEVMREQRETLGRDVEALEFNGADHVKLLQSDPDKYKKAISSFLKKKLI